MRDNEATGDGGAIYNDGGTVTIQGPFGLVSNQAQNGGAIANSAGGTVTVRDGNFQFNESDGDGGVIANFSGTVTVENTYVGQNTAKSRVAASGMMGS